MNPDKMSSTKTEAEIAAELAYPREYDRAEWLQSAFIKGYAAGQESAEVAKLRALVQELVNSLDWSKDLAFAHALEQRIPGAIAIHPDFTRGLLSAKVAIESAASQGYTPTNTTEG